MLMICTTKRKEKTVLIRIIKNLKDHYKEKIIFNTQLRDIREKFPGTTFIVPLVYCK